VISPREVVMAQRLRNFVSRFRRELMVVQWMLCAMLALAPGSPAQTDDSYQSRRTQAFALYENNNFVDALPLLEKLHEEKPGDVAVLERPSAEDSRMARLYFLEEVSALRDRRPDKR